MKKRVVEEKEKKMSIEEVAELYRGHAQRAKEADAAAKPYKDLLTAYAKENPDRFDGSTLQFANGVRIELRESDKPKWNDEAVDLTWVSDAIDAGMGDAVSMGINCKKLPAKPNKEQKALLKEIAYRVEKSQTYAVYADSKK
ncbi:MAG: hypothetical protein LBL04_14035 [Bacteroidales bacterium]|jgi:hypothetical protein|nr:hypothetical protein [Bacteroidales bacterium]